MVDHGAVVHNADRALRADVHALVGDAAAAGFGDAHALDRALVAGDIQHLDDVWIFLVATHSELDALPDDGALLIDAAAHGGLGTRHDFGGDIEQCAAVELILKCKAGHLAQNLIFELLHSGIKQFFHCVSTPFG